MANIECVQHQAQQLNTLREKIDPNNKLGQELAILANAIDAGEITPELLEAERIGFLRPRQNTTEIVLANSSETLQTMVAGAMNPTEIIGQYNSLPDAMKASHTQQMQLIGAMHALAHAGNQEAFAQGLEAFVKTGTQAGRALQVMSTLYRQLPEYMLIKAQRDINSFNETNKAVEDALDGLNPDTLATIAKEANEEATATVEDGITADSDPLMFFLLAQAQHEVLDLAKAMGKDVQLGKEATALRAKQKLLNLNKAQGLIKQVQALTATKKEQEAKLNRLQQQLASAESKGKENAEKLRQQVQEAQQALKDTQGVVAGLEQQITLLKGHEKEAKDLRAKLKSAQDKINNLSQNLLASDKAKKLQDALNAIASELPEVEQQNVNLQLEIVELKEKLTRQGEQLKQAQEGNWANKNTLKKKVAQLEADLKAKQDTLEATLQALGGDKEIASLTEAYNKSLQRVQELEAELASYDPREMLRQEFYAKNDATRIATDIKNLMKTGDRETASKMLSDMPQAKRDEVTKLLLC